MKRSHLFGALGAIVFTFVALSANAALVSILGGQAVYDTDLDISWVGDANLAATNTFGLATGVSLGTHPDDASGVNGVISANGSMNWPGALFWLDAMNASNYLGSSSWRLPRTLVPDNGCTNTNGSPRTDSKGFDCTGSEMGHLFYDEFGADRLTSVLSTGDPTELAKFTNVQSNLYWSGSEVAPEGAWRFGFGNGLQGADLKGNSFFAWAVHSRNVSVVPVPAALWLFGSGLIGLIGMARRNKAA